MQPVEVKVRNFFKREQRVLANSEGLQTTVLYDVCTLFNSNGVSCNQAYKVCNRGSSTTLQRRLLKCHSDVKDVEPLIGKFAAQKVNVNG